MGHSQILEYGARSKLDFQGPEGACTQKAQCQTDSTPYESKRNRKPIRWQFVVLEYQAQTPPDAEWNAE